MSLMMSEGEGAERILDIELMRKSGKAGRGSAWGRPVNPARKRGKLVSAKKTAKQIGKVLEGEPGTGRLGNSDASDDGRNSRLLGASVTVVVAVRFR